MVFCIPIEKQLPKNASKLDAAPNSAIFQDLENDQKAQLEELISYQQYPAGHLLYTPTISNDSLFILRVGRVQIYKLSPENRILTLAILEPQAIFGELALVSQTNQDTFAKTMSDCTIGQLEREALVELVQTYPQIALYLMNLMNQRTQEMMEKLADIAFKSVSQRLAIVLLTLSGNGVNQAPQDPKPLAIARYTHQQLAEMIGSQRETVTKAVGKFRDLRLIRIEDGTLYLTNVQALQKIANA